MAIAAWLPAMSAGWVAARPGLILPEQPPLVDLLGSIRMQIEFYDHLPDL